MTKKSTGFFGKTITKDQSRDTGMAIVLVLLLLAAFLKREIYLAAAIVIQVINMTAPRIFRVPAIFWFGLSHAMGTVVSKVLLSLVFILLVTPVGMVRRMLGRDALKLKVFKSGHASVMTVRDHTFTAVDIEKPF